MADSYTTIPGAGNRVFSKDFRTGAALYVLAHDRDRAYIKKALGVLDEHDPDLAGDYRDMIERAPLHDADFGI